MNFFLEAETIVVQPEQGGVKIVVRSRTGEGELVDGEYLTGFVRGSTIAGHLGAPCFVARNFY